MTELGMRRLPCVVELSAKKRPETKCHLSILFNIDYFQTTTTMAATGVLPFVRGIDFSNYDFKVSYKPELTLPIRKNRY